MALGWPHALARRKDDDLRRRRSGTIIAAMAGRHQGGPGSQWHPGPYGHVHDVRCCGWRAKCGGRYWGAEETIYRWREQSGLLDWQGTGQQARSLLVLLRKQADSGSPGTVEAASFDARELL